MASKHPPPLVHINYKASKLSKYEVSTFSAGFKLDKLFCPQIYACGNNVSFSMSANCVEYLADNSMDVSDQIIKKRMHCKQWAEPFIVYCLLQSSSSNYLNLSNSGFLLFSFTVFLTQYWLLAADKTGYFSSWKYNFILQDIKLKKES